jgi:hypothetical protein
MLWRVRPYRNLIIICIFLLCAAIGFAYLGTPSSQTATDRHAWWLLLSSSIAVNVLTSFGAVLFGVSRVEREMQKYELQRNLGLLADFWGRDSLRVNGFHIVYGGTLGAFRDDERQYSSLATIYSIQALKEIFGKIERDVAVPPHTAFDRLDAKQAADARYNIILLGGYLGIPILTEFPRRANLPYVQDFSDKNRRRIILVREQERISEFNEQHQRHHGGLCDRYNRGRTIRPASVLVFRKLRYSHLWCVARGDAQRRQAAARKAGTRRVFSGYRACLVGSEQHARSGSP